mmetsp:Transcript_20025/g.23055  ORF Transcript_20025/g.23055 Transcript_20025/m.23055 type:complete len:134 (-) Transcript_20025:86-487(-)
MGRHGNEFLEFDLTSDGVLKYSNNSNYRKDSMIKKQVKVGPAVVEEVKRLALVSNVLSCDDSCWPEPNRDGRQELEIRIGQTELSLVTSKFAQLEDVENSNDPRGLTAFHYFVRDVKMLVLSLIGLHFKIKAI